jgi:hypothetical protein
MDYRPVPFWFLNHCLEEKELYRQLALMSGCGVGGFFMHSRAGLKTPYGSEEWFRHIRFIVDTAAEFGLKAWLYDEDPFPSGVVGGTIFFEHPEFAARGVHFHELAPDAAGVVSADLGRGKVLEALAVRRDADGTVTDSFDVSAHIGVVRPDYFMTPWRNAYYVQLREHTTFEHYRAETFNPCLRLECTLPSSDYRVWVCCADIEESDGKFGLLPDNLNPDCVKAFMDATHEKYLRCCGDEFGKTIPGIFTDETNPGAAVPWTARFDEAFAGLHHYSPAGLYHRMFRLGTEDARRFRRHYWETVQHLFEQAFFRPVADWCAANRLQLCGHLISEEDPLGMVDISRLLKYFDIPGFDQITFNIPNGEFFSLSFGGKQISSVALRDGKQQVLCECFACNPFNFGADGMKKIANWLFALDINLLVPHGFYYSYDGYRKHDAGKSFFYHDPGFAGFREFAQYAERIGSRLGAARSLNRAAVLLPISAFRSLHPAEPAGAKSLRAQLFDFCQELTERQVQYDILDETALLDGASADGVLSCEHQRYDAVLVLPACRDLLAPEVRSKLEQVNTPSPGELPPGAGVIRTEVKSGSPAAQYLLVKELPDGILAYDFNNSPEPAAIRFECLRPGLRPFLYDAETDSHRELENGLCAVNGFDALLIEYRAAPPANTIPYVMPEGLARREYEFERHPQWSYIPSTPGLVHSLDRWDIRLANGRAYAAQPFRLLREVLGTELPHIRRKRPIFDQVPQVESLYPVRAVFTAEFEVAADRGALSLVMESETVAGNCRMFLNGREIPRTAFKRDFVYDPFNLCCSVADYCRPGVNRLELIWEQGGEFDGLRSSLYLFER